MNILQLTKDAPYPPSNGAEVRTWKTTEKLTEYGHVWLACPWDDSPAPPGVTLVPLRTPLVARKALAVDGFFGLFALGDRHPLLGLLTRQVVDRIEGLGVRFDLVVTESPQFVDAASVVARAHGATLLVNKHNAYYDLLDQQLTLRRIPGSLRRRAVRNLRRAEQRALEAADVVVFQSANDAERFVAPPRTAVATVPNGTDRAALTGGDPDRLAHTLGLRSEAPVCIYVGSFDYEANAVAARRIDREIAPALPEVEFLLVGRDPPRTTAPNVYAPGFVDDLADAFALADVAICPLPFGSGTKLKMLDYLAAGLPIVTTGVGAQGLPIRDGEHALVREEVDELIEGVKRVLADAELRAHLAANAAELGRGYDWTALLGRYDDLLRDIETRDGGAVRVDTDSGEPTNGRLTRKGDVTIRRGDG